MFLGPVLSIMLVANGLPTASECEPTDETREGLKRLDIKGLTGKRLRERQETILQELLAQRPDDVFLHLQYQHIARGQTDAERNAVIERYKVLANKHPGSTEYQFLYANALVDAKTPDAIARLKSLISAEPTYPPARLELADIYGWGRFADRLQMLAQLDSFYGVCPASLNTRALSLLARRATPEMAAKYSVKLRERLVKETDLDHLMAWEAVWNLEFKAHPPADYAQVRKQLTADLDRLQHDRQDKKDEQWLSLLRTGYKMLGDEAALQRIEGRIVAEYPETFDAKMITREGWSKEHAYPKPDDSEEDKQAYHRAELQMSEDQLKKLPNEFEYIMMRFNALTGLSDSTADQVVAAGETMRKALRNDPEWWSTPPFEFQIAREYLKRKTHIEEVPALVEEGWKSYREAPGALSRSDREPAEVQTQRDETDFFVRAEAANILLDAAEQLRKPAVARAAVEALVDAKPEKAQLQSSLLVVRAKWAELNGRKLDALLLYHAALDARPTDFKPRGTDKDEVAESLARLWKDLGGTSEGKGLFGKKARTVEAATEGRWEKPTKGMPPWQLPDLDGKTWKLESLQGRAVLINVWSTWCGPCRMEHPYLEKLYEMTKERSDIQIITFNIDDEIGDVAPYVKQNKYSFPVLLAKDYVNDLLPLVSIPRNWIVDATGKWQWEQVGFDNTDEQWADRVLEKLEKRKPE